MTLRSKPSGQQFEENKAPVNNRLTVADAVPKKPSDQDKPKIRRTRNDFDKFEKKMDKRKGN